MKRREWISLIILAMTVMASVLIASGQMYMVGVFGHHLKRPETLYLLLEVGIVFCASALILLLLKTNRARMGALLLLAAVFTWIHQVFLPVLVSGSYVAVILRVGSGFRRILDRKKQFPEYHGITAMADIILGSGLLILTFCLLSLLGIGGIGCTRAAAVLLWALSFLPAVSGKEEREKERRRAADFWKKASPIPLGNAIFFGFILAMLLLQAGRMNICADYDSLHYGLRSEYILNDGDGIYENLGSINVVYTYSKGLEILLLPITGLTSYSFFLSFQLWMTAGILLTAGEITALFTRRRAGSFCMALLASIPGITNMGITAKTDSATAMFQLMMVYFLLLYIKKKRTDYLALAGCAFLLTMVLKPTALVFSTALAGTAFLYVLAARCLVIDWKERFLLSWIPMIAMWLLVWRRTWLLTGLPVTSVFYSIWAKLGFTVRYPFLFDSLPSNGGSPFSLSGIKHFVKRLYGVLLAPVSPDMAHVWIAWGTPILLIFLLLFAVSFPCRKKKLPKRKQKPFACLVWMFLTNGLVSLAALYLLWQVDGNYFILLYSLFAILAAIVIGNFEDRFLAHSVVKLFLPIVLFNVSVTAVSNWRGTLGLNPVSLVHKGYFDHQEAAREELSYCGNEKIWDILAEDPETRVLVFGEQPQMLLFPCNAQSYLDIEGSGGNYYVSSNPEALKDYFIYAQIDYIYLGSGYLRPGSEKWRNVTSLLDQGYLTDMIYENGNGLGRFDPDPDQTGEEGAAVAEFARNYWPGEQQ